MGKHGRRHSFDYSCSNDYEVNRFYEQEKQRKVHFDDEYLASRGRKQTRGRSRDGDIQEMGIYETTSKLKESYQNIDKGLDVLRRIYENLLHSKESVRYHSECSQKTFLSEINTLLSQVNELEKSLRKSGNQKREYLEELTRLQQALREDRSKFEANRENRHELHEKMNESTKQTREQQITINKLKKDNENLWRILQEVKKHLLEEDTIQREGELFKNKRFQLPYPPSQEKTNVECELFPIRDNNSVSSLESTGSSATDVMLSEKLKYLISRSENIQSMISKVGEKSSGSRLNRSFSDDCLKRSSLDEKPQRPSRFSSCERTIPEEKRIPAENERGVRCDAKDILRRCEELEKRVEQCSTKDMRDRLMCQLEEMERDGNENLNASRDREDDQYYNTERFCERSKQSHMTKTNTLSSQQQQQQKWHPEVHKKVRGELFKCLDQMSTLEKNFTDAQTEITRLRQYIKETSEHKDFSEKTFKREAIQLRMVVDEKSKEVEVLKQNLNDAIKGLRDSEELIAKVDELERDLEDKEREIKRLKSKHRADYVEIEDRFEQKCTEVETLKTEMRTALEAMERIRVNTTQRKESMRIEETITTEISMLQAAIIEVEERMNMLSTENSTLKIDLDEKLQILGEVTIENEELINRLHACEIELQTYQSNQIDRQAYPLNLNAASYVQQTKRIRQLESDLSKALSEKESILNSTLRNNSYVRIDKTSDEQGQVIESLIDDNEKHLETIQTKDRIIDELQKELRRLNQDSSNEKGSNDSKESVEKYIDIIQRKTKAIEDLRDQLDEARAKLSRQESDENSKESTTKYIDIIQRKTKTIEGLRDQLDDAKIKLSSQESDENSKESIAKYIDIIKQKNQMIEKLREEVNAESDKKLINDLINTLSSKANDKDENNSSIEIELQKIKKILSSSHKDLVGKIITLEEGVDNLRNENRSLRKQMTTKSDAQNEKKMDQQFHQVIEENATLRESLNKPYPGLVQNILLQTDEVKRLHEENELLRLGLSDNKRELVDSNLRKRQRIKDMQTKIAELENERSGSGTTRRVRRRSFSMNEDLVDANQNSSEIESQLRKMEDEKIKMAEKTKQQNKEIQELKDECTRLGRVENSKKALEYEVKNLRDALKNFGGSQPDEKDQKIKDLEEEITVLREELGDGGSYLVPDMEGVLIDSKTKDDLHRMAKIADRERKKAEELQQDSDAWRREKRRLEHAAEESQQNVLKLEDELCDARRDLSRADDEVKQAVEEITKLRDLLEEKTSSEERETEIKNLTDDLNTLQDDRVILQNKLEQVRQKNILLDRENKSLKTNLQESNADNIDVVQGFEEETAKARDEIIELSRELDYLKQQNKELQDINETLVEEVQKMKAKSNETHFKNWLDQDVERRLALLSPDTHRSDLGLDENERQMKKDQQRLIRKLQIENQIMRAKLLSLEEENIASTKIISDMERGHGHLTGTLRSHLILQQHSTAKLLENALQQYTTDYESLKKKFVSLEEKYDRKKGDNSKQRDDIWELFTNAGATITNINTILTEGLVKVDEDLEKDEYGNDFDARDYKSRLWILRRRLSDVENRHRELQLRAEELNLRLDAKQTEFEVTQDELEDATRDLETRENHVQKLKTELDHVAKERSRLARLMNLLKQNQDRMVGDVIADNEALANEMNPKITEIHYYSETGTGGNPDLSSLIAKLKERDTALNIMRKMREENDKENDELKRRINYLERKLKEMTDQRDKLQKEAEYRAGYMSFARDEYGTIHMLRDDLKRIAKENADLKNDIVLKQRQMYDMSKDLHKLRIKLDTAMGSKTGERAPRREEVVEKLINDLASNKAEKFVLETKLKDMERRLKDRDGGTGDLDNVDGQASDAVRVLKQRLVDKEREIEKLKRGPISRSPSPTKSPMPPRDDTMSDVVSAFDSSRSEKNRAQLELKKRLEEVVEENKILTQAIAEKGLKTSADYVKKLKMADKKIAQQRTEINTLNNDNEQKRKRIRELLTAIEEIKDGKSNSKSQKKVNDLINKTKEDEMSSVLEKLKKSKSEVAEWKTKAESYHQELEKVQEKTKSNDSRDFLMDQELHFDGNEATLLTPELPRQQEELSNQEPLYEELEPGYETMYEIAVDGKDASSKKTESTKKSQSRIPVSPVKRLSGKSGKQTEKKSGKEVRDDVRQELDIYRGQLDMNEHDTLDILGRDRLIYVIDFQISKKCMTELRTIKNDVYELEHENETLQTNYVNLAENMSEFNDDLRVQIRGRNNQIAIQNEQLLDQNKKLTTQIEELKNSLEARNIVNDEAQRQVEALNVQVEQQVQEMEVLDETLKNTECELSKIREKEGDWESEINQLNETIINLGNEMEQRNLDNETLSTRLESKTEEMSKLQTGKGGKGVKGAKAQEIKRLKEELKVKGQEVDSVNEALRKKVEEYSKLQKKYKGTNIAEKNKQLKAVKEELLEKTKELQDINEQLRERVEEVHRLKQELKEKSKASQSSKDDLEAIATLRQELSMSSAEIIKRNEIIQELRAHVDKIKEQELAVRQQEQQEFEELEKKYEETILGLNEKIQEKDQESEKYLDETVKAMEEAKTRLIQEINTKKRLEEDVKVLREKIDNLKQKDEIMTKELKEKLNNDKEIMDIAQALESSQTHAQLMEQKMRDMEPQVDILNEKLRSVEGDLEKEKSEVKRLIASLEKGEKELKGILADYDSYKHAAESEIAHVTSEMHLLKKKIGWLEAEKKKVPPPKMPSIEEEIIEVPPFKTTAIEEEIIKPEKVHNSMAVPCDPDHPLLSQGLEELEVELEILQGCNEDLEEELASARSQVNALENEKTELVNELENTRTDLKKTLGYLNDLNEKHEILRREFEESETSLKSQESKMESIESDLRSYRERELEEDESSRCETLTEDQVKSFETEFQKQAHMIEQLQEIIEGLEGENKRKDDAFERLRLNNERNIQELENVTKELESEIQLRADEEEDRKTLTRELKKRDEEIKLLRDQNTGDTGNYEKLCFEIEKLERELDEKLQSEQRLENEMEKWVVKSHEQDLTINRMKIELEQQLDKDKQDGGYGTNRIEALHHEVASKALKIQELEHRLVQAEQDGGYGTNQIEALRHEIGSKNSKIQTLQQEIQMQEDQSQILLSSLNKRREESKQFLTMQQKFRDEIDSKEDLIRKLNFKLKSNDLDVTASSLNVSRDDDLSQSEDELDNRDVLSTNQDEDVSDSIVELSKQLNNVRTRNKNLSRDLEKCRGDYIRLKEEKDRLDLTSQNLKEDIEVYKDRITELRSMLQASPDMPSDEDGSNAVGVRTKLYASYKELREKSIEIASLRMCIDIKDDEIRSLREEIEQLRGINVELRGQNETISEIDEKLDYSKTNNVKVLVEELNNRERTEQDLHNQIAELRQRLMQKCKQSDKLQLELNKVTNRFRDIEQKLCQNDRDTRERFLHVFENDNSEISEVTPLNSIKLFSALDTQDASNLTGDESDTEDLSLNENFTRDDDCEISRLRELQLKTQEQNLFYQEQVKSLQNEIQRIKHSNKTTNNENENLQRLLSELQIRLQQLETTKTDVLNELQKGRDENMILGIQINQREERHKVELENLKTCFKNVETEHMASIKKRMETSFQEKIVFQVKAKQLANEVKRKDLEIETLKKRVRQ